MFVWLQNGWTALSEAEREEVRRLVGKSGGRPRNLTRAETQRLGTLAAKAANAAARSPREQAELGASDSPGVKSGRSWWSFPR